MKSKSKENKTCIFCDRRTINEGLLDETENFYLRANMRGAIAPGHVMLISKSHFSCFGEMPSYLDREYLDFSNEIEEKVKNAFFEPIMVEQGINGQSIYHAHSHFFPAVSEWYNFSRDKHFTDFIPEIPVTEGKYIGDIRRVFEEEGQYVAIKEDGKLYICHTKDYEGLLRPVRAFPSELTGLIHLLYWQTTPDSEKEKNQKWIKETIQKLGRGK